MACRTAYCPGCDAIVHIAEGRCWPHAHLVGYPVLPADPRQTAGPAQSTAEARETGGASPLTRRVLSAAAATSVGEPAAALSPRPTLSTPAPTEGAA